MRQYKELLSYVLENGEERTDRTGVGTLSVFGYQNRYNLAHGFPLVTTKSIHIKSMVHELLWFLKGDTNVKYLEDNGVRIWSEWKDENGDLGPIYGQQWRSWTASAQRQTDEYWGSCGWVTDTEEYTYTIDQIAQVIEQIKTNPYSRRHIVSAWNVGELHLMKLPPCHCLFQFYVSTNGKLSCQLYQRSADVFLGVPFNIASYALLTHMIAQVCGLKVGEFVHTMGDVHLYKNHIEQAKLQLTRECRGLPKLVLNPNITNIDDFKFEDIAFEGYSPHPAIKAEVAV